MINYKTLRIPNNYVLVLPDADHETYRFGGVETNILVGTTAERHKDDDIEKELVETCQATGQHKSVRGRVFKVCDKLIFNGDAMRKERKYFSNDRSSMSAIQDLKQASALFDVNIEVEEGDIVYFNYAQHYECYEQGRYIETDLGDMLIMRYDCLILSIDPTSPNEVKKMLNGLILIEKKDVEPERESKIILPFLKNKEGQRPGKFSYAEIIKTGERCRGYLEDLTAEDDPRKLNEGEYVIYRPNAVHLLEWGLHQVMFGGKEVYAIHRKDLLLVIPKKEEVCLN